MLTWFLILGALASMLGAFVGTLLAWLIISRAMQRRPDPGARL